MTAERRIAELHLRPHPEGGFYRETWRSPVRVQTERGERSACTAILFLLPAGAFSTWHRVHGADEIWNFYAGDPLALHVLDAQGHAARILGPGGAAHHVVPAGHWQAAEPERGAHGWSLVGCTVAPGFEFADFEMADAQLAAFYPEHAAVIRRLLR